MASRPRPLHFLVRPGMKTQTGSGAVVIPGPLVPLIPVDQLPDWLEVVGVPRELKVEQTVGLTNLGTYSRGEDSFDIRVVETDNAYCPSHSKDKNNIDAGSQPRREWADEEESEEDGDNAERDRDRVDASGFSASSIPPRQERHPPPTSSSSSSPSSSAAVGIIRHPAEHLVAAAAAASPHPRHPQPQPHAYGLPTVVAPAGPRPAATKAAPGPVPVPVNSAYCRHWCQHGRCKWGLYCRYLHLMPTSAEALAEVGLADFPPWYRAAVALARTREPGGGMLGVHGMGMNVGSLGATGGMGGMMKLLSGQGGEVVGGGGSDRCAGVVGAVRHGGGLDVRNLCELQSGLGPALGGKGRKDKDTDKEKARVRQREAEMEREKEREREREREREQVKGRVAAKSAAVEKTSRTGRGVGDGFEGRGKSEQEVKAVLVEKLVDV